jgi:hypothetical protein
MSKLLALTAATCALCASGGTMLVGPATAAGLTAPVADCVNNNGQLTHGYPAAQLRNALATMPGYLAEYSNCYAVIQRALFAKIHNLGGGPGSGGGSFLPTWLIAVLAVLVLGGSGFAAVAIRRRR